MNIEQRMSRLERVVRGNVTHVKVGTNYRCPDCGSMEGQGHVASCLWAPESMIWDGAMDKESEMVLRPMSAALGRYVQLEAECALVEDKGDGMMAEFFRGQMDEAFALLPAEDKEWLNTRGNLMRASRSETSETVETVQGETPEPATE